jgi:CRP-like cAMP-binding protein
MVKQRPVLSSRPPPIQNLLLSSLPSAELDRIAPALQTIPLKLKVVLHKPGERVDHVYFPGGGFCSILTTLKGGEMVEVATIGREGVLGADAAFGSSPPSSLTMVQGETDTCYRMTADALRTEMDRRGPLYQLIIAFSHAMLGVVMQATACNAVHSIEQRLARWLLLAQDRMEDSKFPLTQEFVAMMLGASRPTVTVVAGTLQNAGLIKYHRGEVTIVDREKLEAASCECYRTTNQLLRAVTGGR